jgi:ATP-dependent DNA helicase RecG
MNPDKLQTLIAGGESHTIEFKSDRGPLSDHDLVDTVVCLSNSQGGTLIIGVEDDGKVTGLDPCHQTSANSLEAMIASRTVPPLTVKVDFVTLSKTLVAVITIPAGRTLTATSLGKVLIRYMDSKSNPGCRPLYPYEMESWRADRGLIDPSARVILSATWNDLDQLELVRLRRMIEKNRGDTVLLNLSDNELARALGFVRRVDDILRPTLAGLLLVGKETALINFVPSHEVAFQVLNGTDVIVNEFRRWPLLRIVEWVLESFQVRNEERELNLGLFRIGIPAYDRRGFREAINNALIHRDFARLGAIHIQMHNNHIRITNPGGFIEGIRLDNLLVAEPRPRNPLLADVFKRVGLVERIGRGVAIIFNGQLRNGRLPPDYGQSTESSVNIVIPGGPADLDFVQIILSEENKRQHALQVNELLILAHIWRERSIDTPTTARLTQRDESHARTTLENLVEVGLIERRGSKRGRSYLLSASVYRTIGKPADYVRVRGFEPEQMEQMILQYVRAHDRIVRHEVADLCRIGPYQATRLLQKMVKKGKLVQRGERKGAFYTLRSNI